MLTVRYGNHCVSNRVSANSMIKRDRKEIMAQFLKVKTADEVLSIITKIEPLPSESISLEIAHARVLSSALTAPEPLPHFSRATMDGFAVRAKDTFGATESLPTMLEVVGEIVMGESVSLSLDAGKAVAVPTGGMLPANADSVVMVEYTYNLDEKTIEVIKPVAPGDNILRVGEDIENDQNLFPAGWRLRPQDIGLLAALGISRVPVHRRPRVAVISTGDEIVPITDAPPPPGKVRDINSITLAAELEEAGAAVTIQQVVVDDLDALVAAANSALVENDMLLLSGGSSVGARDYTLQILDHFENAELLVHGVAIRPGKPTILARIGKKIFWGLPGQPVSALMIYRALVIPSLARLEGQEDMAEWSGTRIRAILNRQLPSVQGRTDYVPVMNSRVEGKAHASPIFGKSAMIGILARADGFIIVPEHVEGLAQGSEVEVHLFSR